jgi:hypothetical protein
MWEVLIFDDFRPIGFNVLVVFGLGKNFLLKGFE